MKKILILIIMCFILTGCSTEVNLKIDSENVFEQIKIYDLKSNVYINNIIKEDIQSNLEAFEREYEFYTIKEFEENGYVGKTYDFNESIDLWWEMSHIRACYDSVDLRKTTTHISLTTSNEYRCGYLFGANDVKLIIDSDLTVNSSNADEIVGNKLIWNITSSNYKNKNIEVSYKLIDSKETIKVNEEQEEESSNQYIKYVLLSLGIIILIVGIIIFIKIKNSNK